MGFYVNPPYMSKEIWLEAYPVVDPQATGFIAGGELLVCLVDNGPLHGSSGSYQQDRVRLFHATGRAFQNLVQGAQTRPD